MKKLGKNIVRVLLLVALLLVIYVGIDLLLAAVLIKEPGKAFRASHSYYHHGLIANQQAFAGWYNIDYPMFTNSLGFRDSKVRNIPLVTDKRRILFMGDSHTEGVGIPFEDTFTGQVMAGIDTTGIEILNAAAVSYSPRIYYLKTKFLIEVTGLKFDELFVFMDLSDLQNEIVYQHFTPTSHGTSSAFMARARSWLINRSFAVHTLSNYSKARHTSQFLEKTQLFDEYREDEAHVDALELYASFFSGFDDKTLLSNPMFHGVAHWMYDPDFSELAKQGLSLGSENMLKLLNLCKEHGIKMTISVHPWQEQIKRRDANDMYVSFWEAFAREHQAGFINLYPIFIDPPVSAALGLEYFIPGDNHWNRNGHWLAAREIIRVILADTN